MSMRNRERNRADALAGLRNDMVALAAVLGGEFDDRIAELTKLKREIDEVGEIRETLDEAKRVLNEAQEFDAQVKSAAKQAALAAGTRDAELAEKAAQLAAKEDSLAKREFTLSEGRRDLEQQREEFDGESTAVRESLARQADELKAAQGAVASARAEVAALKDELNRRLEALRVA